MAEHAWLRPGDAWRFVEALGDLPAERWFQAGLKAREGAFARGVASRALAALERDDAIALLRWQLQDDIETAAWCCLPGWYRTSAGHACPPDFVEAVEAAHVAAIAVLLRLRLGEHRFSVLYAPFADLVPRAWLLAG